MPSFSPTLDNFSGGGGGSTSDEQFGRKISLIVASNSGDGIDLSKLRIKFSVKRSDTQTPNTADIRVYNVSAETANAIFSELSPKRGADILLITRGQVILQAGYESNYGVIFKGNIKQIIRGRESATDTFIDIIAGDGQNAYNFAVVNKTLAAGATIKDQVDASVQSMNSRGVTAGQIADMPPEQLPRGKVMYGTAKQYLRNAANSNNQSWSIQDEQVTFVSNKSYLPGEAVNVNSKTGMIGTPQQTTEGVNVKCLLNPKISLGGRIFLNNASVELLKVNQAVAGSPANFPAPQDADGYYYVLVAEHQGDTRGVEWYTTMICLAIDPTTNPINSININRG